MHKNLLAAPLALILVAACSGGGSGGDNLGACSRAITDYVFLNGPDDFDPNDDYSTEDGSGNNRVAFVEIEGGVVMAADFRWGPDHVGCEVSM